MGNQILEMLWTLNDILRIEKKREGNEFCKAFKKKFIREVYMDIDQGSFSKCHAS